MIALNANVKRLIILGVVLLGAGLYFAFRLLVAPDPPSPSGPPGVQFVETKLVGRKEGARQWEILTKSVVQQDGLVTIGDMEKVTVFQGEKPHLDIRAREALWKRKEDTLTLLGDVEVEGRDEEFWLKSDLLIHTGADSTLTSPGPVQMVWSGLKIRADEMVYESESGLLYLIDNVVIQDGELKWGLKQAVYDLNRDVLDFYGQIVLETKAGAGDEEE